MFSVSVYVFFLSGLLSYFLPFSVFLVFLSLRMPPAVSPIHLSRCTVKYPIRRHSQCEINSHSEALQLSLLIESTAPSARYENLLLPSLTH